MRLSFTRAGGAVDSYLATLSFQVLTPSFLPMTIPTPLHRMSLLPKQVSDLSDRLYARAEVKKLHLEHLAQQARKDEGTFKPTIFTSSKHRE